MRHPKLDDVGPIIRAARVRAKLTQGELAARAGMSSQSIVSRVETGAHTPSLEAIFALAKALGCRPRELLP